ncbi:MAG: DUF4831 family protein [Bacteroidaceae bacterium]
MKIKRIMTVALLMAVAFGGKAQTEVTPFVPGSTLEGISYFLPRTAFRVTIKADRTVTKPGDFNKYAERYLHLNGVPTTESVHWEIKSITLEPYGVPDKTKAYSIKLRSKTVAPLVGLSRDGLLLSINTDAEETILPALPQTTQDPVPADPRAYMTQEILSAGSIAKMAELCAQEIYDIRESRNALVRGEADNTPKDGAQLQLMLNQLAQQDQVLTSLFSGTTHTTHEVFSLTYDPTQETAKDILFRFSSKLGVLGADDLAGDPVYISVKCTETLPAAVADEQVDKKKAKMEKGVYYNVPVRTKLTVFDSEREYNTLETPMGQFGSVEILSNLLFDKKTTTKVTFFQNTGGTKDVME